jgi:cell division inhibitor SepF
VRRVVDHPELGRAPKFILGGVPQVLKMLLKAGLLHGDCMTITGRTMAEELAHVPDAPRADQDVIRPIDQPLYKQGHLAILRGNLATDTAVHADVRHEVRPADPVSVGDLYRITTLHPRSYNDARRIGEEFRDGVPVIMNLSDMDDTEAKRLVDFAAGLIFGCRGSIERITNKVFLLSPQNVDVAAEAHRLAQDGFFNQS